VAKPAERWPDCADALFVRDNEWLLMAWDDSDQDGPRRRTFAGWQSIPQIIANGDPLIGQFELQLDSPDDAPGELESDDADGAGPSPWRYLYGAIRPTRFDDQGNIEAFERWTVECGPIDEDPDEPLLGAKYVTERPFPGLTINGDNCTAESADAVRRAAVLSETLDAHGAVRWVRDGWR